MKVKRLRTDDILRPTDAEIRARANELYIESGRLPGRELENWLEAEAELLAERAALGLPRKSGQGFRPL